MRPGRTAPWAAGGAVVIAGVVTVVAATIAAAHDARRRRLPDRWVLVTGLAPGVAVVTGASAVPDVVAGLVLAAGPLLVVHLVAPSAIGFGDVKFAAALGAVCGLVDARLALLAVCLGSLLTAVAGLASRRAEMPFGPGLWLGTVVACLVGPSAFATTLPTATGWILGERA